MTPELIIGIVSAIIGVGFVKVWLYKVIKYKMDEGIVLQFFNDQPNQVEHSVDVIAKSTELSVKRVLQVCNRSALFEAVGADNWRLASNKG